MSNHLYDMPTNAQTDEEFLLLGDNKLHTVPLEGNVTFAHKISSSKQNHSIEFRVPLYL